jgi:formylglycine-generating enzyme required for sulfatase activity
VGDVALEVKFKHLIMKASNYVTFILLAALGMFVLVPAASGQTLFVEGKTPLLRNTAPGQAGSIQSSVQVGAQLWYTNLFRLQGSVSYQQALSAGGALQAHPFRLDRMSPYGFVEIERVFANRQADERSIVSLGVGLEYEMNNTVSVHGALARQWNLSQDLMGDTNLGSSVAPRLGVSFNLGGFMADRSEPTSDEPLVTTASADSIESEGDESEGETPSFGNPTPPGRQGSEAERAPTGEGEPPAQQQGGEAERVPTVDGGGPPARQGGEADPAPAAPNDGDANAPLDEKDEMVRIPDGTFLMGLTDENPLQLQQAGRKRITVSSFYMEKYEVSNAEYRAFLDELSSSERQDMLPDSTVWEETGSRSNWQEYFRGSAYSDYPVIGVTYEQARSYCEAQDKRLPTEAEWEYAARAGRVGGIYPWPGFEPRNEEGKYLANYNPGRGGYAADGYAFTAPVDAFPPNAWGLYNVSGNVAEWVRDAFTPSYSNLSDFNPLYESSEETRRVVRGGSWASDAFYIGVGVREAQEMTEASPYIGIRCAMSVANANQNAQPDTTNGN